MKMFILPGNFVIGKVDTTLCECLVPFPLQMKDKLVETMITVKTVRKPGTNSLFDRS